MAEVNIAGVMWKVKTRDQEDWGTCEKETRTIFLRKEGYNDQITMEDVLLHEMIHAIIYATGGIGLLDSGVEEIIVHSLERNLWLSGVIDYSALEYITKELQ